jgi:hypothetical protein
MVISEDTEGPYVMEDEPVVAKDITGLDARDIISKRMRYGKGFH